MRGDCQFLVFWFGEEFEVEVETKLREGKGKVEEKLKEKVEENEQSLNKEECFHWHTT